MNWFADKLGPPGRLWVNTPPGDKGAQEGYAAQEAERKAAGLPPRAAAQQPQQRGAAPAPQSKAQPQRAAAPPPKAAPAPEPKKEKKKGWF